MKFYVAKIVYYYNECQEDMSTDYVCVTGKNFSDAMKNVANYYGETLDTVELKLINNEHPLIVLPDYATYEIIRKDGSL